MPAFLVPLIAAGASALGSYFANKSAKKEARHQEAYQTEMSNTAVQRSVQDYKAAGLNPALAYDRSASSPGGTAAQIGNVFEQTSSNALAWRAQQQQNKIAAAQSAMDLLVKKEQMGAIKAANARDTESANLAEAQKNLARQQLHFNIALQPGLLKKNNAEAELSSLLVPGAQNTANFERMMGRGTPGISMARNISEILKNLGGLRR